MRRPGVDIGKKLHEMTLDEFERYFNSWFYGRRDQFGTNGWEDLLGENISVYDVDGGVYSSPLIPLPHQLTDDTDHFSMMIPPHSLAVGGIVRDVLRTLVKIWLVALPYVCQLNGSKDYWVETNYKPDWGRMAFF